MSVHERISLVGISGREWLLSGFGAQDVMMAPNSTGLYETAVETRYTDASYGARFEGVHYPATTIVWTAEIGASLEHDPETWHSLYSDFRADLDYKLPCTVKYDSSDGLRTRKVRLVSEPKPFSTYNFEGKDPHLFSFGSIVLTMQTELPFYVGASVFYEWADPNLAGNGGATWFPVTLSNPGSVEVWKKFTLSDQARWIIPDPSFGQNDFARGRADRGRVSRIPLLAKGEGVTVDSNPDERTIVAENDAPVHYRYFDDLIYPIPPGKKQDFTVRVLDCTNPDGAHFRMEIPRWHLNPFGRPRITL